MQLSRTSTTAALTRDFADLRATLERYDSNFEQWGRRGSIYPARSVVRDYDELAVRFDDARTELRDRFPEQTLLNRSLRADALYLARLAGKLDLMAENEITFGSGWGRSLDDVIDHTRRAVELLTRS